MTTDVKTKPLPLYLGDWLLGCGQGPLFDTMLQPSWRSGIYMPTS